MSRPGGALAVLIGAVIGVTAAFARRGEEPAPPANTAAPEPAPVEAPKERPAPEPTVAAAVAVPTLAGSGPITAESAPAPAPSVEPLAVPAAPESVEELQATEVRCYAQDPPSCRRAAMAYEAGGLVPRDRERAQNFRKVELTQLVRLCEKRKPLACVRLAELYAAGEIVAGSTRKAEQLLSHARDLCARRPSEECGAVPAP